MEKQTEDDLIDSHDELVKVCQALMGFILKRGNMRKSLDPCLKSHEIKPGFAERAEIARRKAMRERILRDAN